MNATTVTVSTVADTIRRALARFPRERSRIERAATLIALGHVEQTGPDAFTVRSQTDADVTYTVTRDDCPCQDSQRRPELVCKHRWGASLVVIAEQRQRVLDARENEQAQRAAVSADTVALAYARRIGWAA